MVSAAADLIHWLNDARRRTLEIVADLSDEQLMGPRLAIVNPLRWEIAHVAWFHEQWVLRHALGRPPIRADGDALYDSSAVAHDTRWDLPLPSRQDTLAYMDAVRERIVDVLEHQPSEDVLYFAEYAVYHEDMHDEAFTYTRQTLGYPAPRFSRGTGEETGGSAREREPEPGGALPGDVEVRGGVFELGARPGNGFVFDNEKWAHTVEVQPLRMARAPVTQSEFAAFVDAGGYLRKEFWSEPGWTWRTSAEADQPVYWRKEDGVWLRRDFDRWLPLEPHRPVIHVNWYEAQAYCRWARRRLPTEAEWEAAASLENGDARKRRFPWGGDPPTPERANLDGLRLGCVNVNTLPAGQSATGCRHMFGNVWEWTASPFLPYPGFVPDNYKDYSQPWFGNHYVLRGGCWATRSRLVRNTWRNFYMPDRRDVWAGFRTCALE